MSDAMKKLKQAKEMLDMGAIDQEMFESEDIIDWLYTHYS